MGKSDLDPRTIDLNLNVNLPIEILYQYEYAEKPYIARLSPIEHGFLQGEVITFLNDIIFHIFVTSKQTRVEILTAKIWRHFSITSQLR